MNSWYPKFPRVQCQVTEVYRALPGPGVMSHFLESWIAICRQTENSSHQGLDTLSSEVKACWWHWTNYLQHLINDQTFGMSSHWPVVWVLQGSGHKHQHCYPWWPDTWHSTDKRLKESEQRTTRRRKWGPVGIVTIGTIPKECTRQPWNYWNIQTMTNTTKWQ